MTPANVVGLDLSLTATGVAVLNGSELNSDVFKITSKGKADDDLAARQSRLSDLRRRIWDYARKADLVAIEGPAYSKVQGHAHDRSGLWWLVTDWLLESPDTLCTPVVEIPPQLLKKYATGKGNASKDQVLAAVVRRYPAFEVNDNNEADALVLAAMASRHLGNPIEDSLPATHLAAMDAVHWPNPKED